MKPSFRTKERIGLASRKLFPMPKACVIGKCLGMGERHHLTYDDPYNFIWLCKLHHRHEHVEYFVSRDHPNNMRTAEDIKLYCMPHLIDTPGLLERIQNRVGFKVLWSRMDILQTVMVFLACEAECGNVNANSALRGMLVYMNDKPNI